MVTFIRSLVLCACFAACGMPSPAVETTSASISSFDRYRTFTLEFPREAPSGYEVTQPAAEVQLLMKPMVLRSLTEKGWVEVPSDADVVVVIAVGRRETQKTRSLSRSSVVISGDREETIEVPEGAIVIDAFDTKTRVHVWHGIASGEIKGTGSIDTKRLTQTVDRIMTPFPAVRR